METEGQQQIADPTESHKRIGQFKEVPVCGSKSLDSRDCFILMYLYLEEPSCTLSDYATVTGCVTTQVILWTGEPFLDDFWMHSPSQDDSALLIKSRLISFDLTIYCRHMNMYQLLFMSDLCMAMKNCSKARSYLIQKDKKKHDH